MTYINCKSCFYYSVGHKIKKTDMKNILTHKINHINESSLSKFVSYEDFKYLFFYYKCKFSSLNDNQLIIKFYLNFKENSNYLNFQIF